MGWSSRAVAVASAHRPPVRPRPIAARPTLAQAVVGLYNWLLWLLLLFLVLSQLLVVFWNSTSTVDKIVYGQSPLLGAYAIPGQNDEPYSDRSIVCLLQGRHYNPVTVNDALEAASTTVVDSNGTSITGYRVVKRATISLDPATFSRMANMCDELSGTLNALAGACSRLGYSVVRDGLRIVDGADGATTYHVQAALPVLILPFWDNSVVSRFAIPGADGSACMFRAHGRYYDDTAAYATITAADRATREQRTAEWLGDRGGVWRNGWYEDSSGSRWYSDVITDEREPPLLVGQHTFDMDSGAYLGMEPLYHTRSAGVVRWGRQYSLSETHTGMKSVAIANGSRFGLFLYSSLRTQRLAMTYDMETLVSNTSVVLLLFRWMLVMVTLQKSFLARTNPWENAGIGCLAYSQTFLLLPLALLPRLKTTLMAFFSLGCTFEGSQMVFTEAWFLMYPAIAEFVLLFFSLLNVAAMGAQRRVSDAGFGPTLLFFCGMHFVRLKLAQSGWFEGFDGRITALVTSQAFERLRLADFASTDVALRINGNVRSMFCIKLAVLALNAAPLLFSSRRAGAQTGASGSATAPARVCAVERALCFRASACAGLGSTARAYLDGPTAFAPDAAAVRGYELLRLGYVQLGARRLVPLAQWASAAALSLTRWTRRHVNYRVIVLDVAALRQGKDAGAGPESDALAMRRLDEPEWDAMRPWQLTIQPLG